jgi:hypothetical protein
MPELPPFAANPQDLFELPVEDLGRLLLNHFIAAQAEKLNIPSDQIPERFVEMVRRYVLTLEANTAGDAAVEKALHKAALGDFSAAGAIIRQHQINGAIFVKLQNFRKTEIERRAKARRAGGQAAAELRLETVGPRHDRIRKQGAALLQSGTSPRDLAGILAKQFNFTPRQIRKILGQKKSGTELMRDST